MTSQTSPEPDTATTELSTRPSLMEMRAIMMGSAQLQIDSATSPIRVHARATPLPAHRAFFCRFDDDLDARKIPLRLRVGDLPTVNKMERKPGW